MHYVGCWELTGGEPVGTSLLCGDRCISAALDSSAQNQPMLSVWLLGLGYCVICGLEGLAIRAGIATVAKITS